MWRCVSVALLVVVSAGQAQETRPVEQVALTGPRFLAGTAPGARTMEPGSVPMLARRVTLTAQETTLGDALKAITRQTGVRFLLSPEIVPVETTVRVEAAGLSLAAALTELLLTARVDVAVVSASQLALVRRRGVVADTGAIAGRVTDAKTGAPLVGAEVTVEGTRRGGATGNDGRYRITEVSPGTYTLRARYIGYTPGSTSVTVTAGQEAAADFALEKSAQRLDEVVTTGTVVPTEVKALPSPISVISDSDIALQRPHSTQEIFRQAVPTAVSWDLQQYPYDPAFSTRGASTLSPPSAMKVFIDGIEAVNPVFAAIDVNSIERIEVIRGPQAAAIYGSDALGGVMQIFTKRGDVGLNHPQVSAEAQLGILQTPYAGYGGVLRQAYNGGIRGGNADLGYNLGAGYSRLGEYLPHGELSAQSNPSVYGGAHFGRGIVSADVTGRYYLQNNPLVKNPALTESGFFFYAKPYYQLVQYQNEALGARLTVAARRWWQQALTVGLDRFGSDGTQTQARLTSPGDTLLSVSSSMDAKASIGYTTSFQGSLSRGVSASVTAGFDHYSLFSTSWSTGGALTTSGTIATDPEQPVSAYRSRTNNTGIFGQIQLGLWDALYLTGGLRAERNSNFGDSLGTPLSPRVGVSYAPSIGGTTLKLRGSWGRAIRAPGSGLKAGSTSPYTVKLANPLLGPERQQGWDAGADVSFGTRGSIGITYYDQTALNLIQLVLLQLSPIPTYQNQNVGRVKNTGVEIEGALRVGPANLRAQYGYTRANIEELGPNYSGDLRVGDQAQLTPKHTAGASIEVAPTRRTTVAAGLTYVGSWNTYDYVAFGRCASGNGPCPPSYASGSTRDFIVAYPGFVKLNLTLSQRLTQALSTSLSIDNLANSQAYELYNFSPVFGRTTTVGLRYQY